MPILASPRSRLFSIALAAGVFAGAALPVVAGATTKRMAIGVAALVAGPVLLAVRDRERLCLAAFVFLVTVKIDYYILGLYAPHSGGAEGLYVKPSDLPLIGLYALWLIDAAAGRSAGPRRSLAAVWLLAPFLLVGLLSALLASNTSWALYEWVRWVRAAAVLLYVTARLRAADAPFVLASLALVVSAQSLLGLAQTGLRRSFGLDRLGVIGEGSESVMAQDFGLSTTVVRAAGTLSHPNVLGAYLDLTLPVFLALALVDRHPRRRWIWIGTLLVGVPALVCTLSRASWGAFAIGCAAAMGLLVWDRLLDIKRALTLSFVGAALALAAMAPIAPVIAKRLSFNFSESLDFRDDMNRLAVRMFERNPVFGVGLNNFTVAFQQIAPQDAEKMRREWGTIAAAHNLYLLVLSETGLAGFSAFSLFWTGYLVRARRAAGSFDRWGAASLAGTIAGLAAAMAGDLLAFALWVDTMMLTAIMLAGLLEPLRDSNGAPEW